MIASSQNFLRYLTYCFRRNLCDVKISQGVTFAGKWPLDLVSARAHAGGHDHLGQITFCLTEPLQTDVYTNPLTQIR